MINDTTSQPQTALTTTFSGSTLVSYVFRGRLAWIAADVGVAIGYEPGGFRTCLGQWDSELIDGQDVEILRGADLKEFKGLLDDRAKFTLGRASRLTILRESGVHVVCLKTTMALGRVLRRHLADEVLPKLVRREPILPAPMRAPAPVLAPVPAPVSVLGEWSPDAIGLRRAELLAQLAREMSPTFSPEARDSMRSDAAAILRGHLTSARPAIARLPDPRIAQPPPSVATDGAWRRPNEIARKLGVTLAAIGRAITDLGLRGGEHSRSFLDQRSNGTGLCEVFEYDSHAVALLREHFAAVAKPLAKTHARGAADVVAAIDAASKPSVAS